MILIYITCKNKKEAKKISSYLIKKRMVGCCNIFSIDSIYRRNNKIVKDKEMVLILKTSKKNFTIIEKEVKKLHSYDVSCILEIPVGRVNLEYLRWINKEL